ncbi:MAG: toprim domain-containing protein, partial [Candidatus Xenobia bacterium]
MGRAVIIVESPAKAKTIQKYVGTQYVVRASMGHVRDLPPKDLGVDIAAGFKPTWQTIGGKGNVLSSLKQAVAGSSRVYLATDPDREGEAIAWHLAQVLRLTDASRIELHEITPQAVKAALGNPHRINTRRVAAQQARRILDRLVGYKLSPLLCRKVSRG